jgi:uncharacterized protein YfaS (alpha-2-macroglobulin family)
MRVHSALLVGIVVLSCEKPGSISEPSPPPAAPPAPEIAVTFTSPAAGREEVREVTAIFSRPMDTRELPIALTPAVPGEARWLGDHTLVFTPRAPLPEGRYEASISGSARAKSGAVLGSPHRWSFTSARQRPTKSTSGEEHDDAKYLDVEWMSIREGRALSAGREVQVTFNAPPQLDDLRALARFEIPGAIAIRTEPRTIGKEDRILAIRPEVPLPEKAGVEVKLVIDAGVRARDGFLPMRTRREGSFPTFVPLRVQHLDCPIGPNGRVLVRLSDSVDTKRFLEEVQVEPPLPLRLFFSPERSEYVSFSGPFVKETTYRFTLPVAGDSKDLSARHVATCAVPAPRPTLRFATEGFLLESGGPKEIPLWSSHTPRVRLRLSRVSPERLPAAMQRHDLPRNLPFVREELRPAHPRLHTTQHLFDPSAALTRGHGLALLEAEASDEKGTTLTGGHADLLVNVTDLGLTTKHAPTSTLVWVTRLSTGRPVSGATVRAAGLDGTRLAEAQTDEDGVAELVTPPAGGGSEGGALDIFAAAGDDLAWLRTDHKSWHFSPDIEESSADLGWRPGQAAVLRGMIFTERGVYRPGDTVRLKAIVRSEAAQLETRPGHKVRVDVADSRGKPLLTREMTLSEFGTFTLDVPLAAAAPLGEYTVSVHEPGHTDREGLSADFRVDEYRTPDFEVKVSSSRTAWFAWETPEIAVSARYLFGAKMPRAPLRWKVTRRRSSFTPPHHPSFAFRPEIEPWEGQRASPRSRYVASEEGFLDEAGERTIPVRYTQGDETYTVEAEVTGLDRTTVAGRAQLTVHPASFYLGIQSAARYLELGEPLRGDLVAVEPSCGRVAGVPIEAVLYHGSWRSVRRLNRYRRASTTSRPGLEIVGRCRLRSQKTPVSCALTPREGGHYVLWASALDAAGREAVTSLSFYVFGHTRAAWRRTDSEKIVLHADEREYRVGQTARILVENPFPEAEALITIERERVLQRFRQRLIGPAPALRIPVTEEMLPNVFVSAVLTRGRLPGSWPRASDDDDPGRPAVRVGYALVRVSPEARRMKVALSPERLEYRPREEVMVRLRTTDLAGQAIPAEVAVWAADEGVLSLTDYTTPDPVPAMGGVRGLGVVTTDNRVDILRREGFTPKGRHAGGGGGHGPARTDFRAVAFFDPAVRTDLRGEATVRFRLPDTLTTFRIMAVATSRGQRFGRAEAKVVCKRPLLLQPALPRFVRAGDRFEAGVVVHNLTAAPGAVTVRARGVGVAIEGKSEAEARVESRRRAEVRFAFVAKQPGVARFRFEVALGKERDALEVTRPVHLDTATESVGVNGEARAETTLQLAPPVPARRDAGRLELVVSGSRLAGVAGGFTWLLEYPYGCGEQTTSRLLALLALREVAEVAGEALARDPADMIRAGIARLSTFQTKRGGFSLWSGGEEEPWVTSYILFALAEAAKRGHEVDAGVIERGLGRLRALLSENRGIDAMTKAYALYALAAFGLADEGLASLLFADRAQMGTDGRALLAHTLWRMGDGDRAGALLHELIGEARVDEGGVRFPAQTGFHHFGSEVRTMALVLEALAPVDPGHPLVAALAKGLLAATRDGHWYTTQETASALLALSASEREESPVRQVRVLVGDEERLAARFGPGEKAFRKLLLPASELPGIAPLRVLPSGGAVHYSARLVFVPEDPPRAPRDQGIAIARTYEPVRAVAPGAAGLATPSESEIAAGSLVRVTLHLAVAGKVEHVVVDDALPAGLEPVNLSLATSPGEGENAASSAFTHDEMHDDRVILYANALGPGLYRYPYLARAVTPGRFSVPAARAEAMYDPSVTGATAAGLLTVVAPAGGVATR